MYLPARPALRRRGLSLLEVLVALAIFLLSFVALGKLVTLSSDQAAEVQMQSQATQMAQSKMNEVLAGSLPLSSQSGNIDEDPDWQWSIDAEEQSDINGLWTVTVRVFRQVDDHQVESTLAQMILDPSIRGSMFDQLTVTGSTDTASSSSSSSNSSSSQQGAQSAAAGATKPTTKPTTSPGKPKTTPGKPKTAPGKPTTPTTPTTPTRPTTPTAPTRPTTPTTPTPKPRG